MFLRCKVRRKDGKKHRYWSVVENTRTARGRVVQRHVLYLGEINDTQELAWRRSIEVLEEGATQPRTLSLFPEDRCAGEIVRRQCPRRRYGARVRTNPCGSRYGAALSSPPPISLRTAPEKRRSRHLARPHRS